MRGKVFALTVVFGVAASVAMAVEECISFPADYSTTFYN